MMKWNGRSPAVILHSSAHTLSSFASEVSNYIARRDLDALPAVLSGPPQRSSRHPLGMARAGLHVGFAARHRGCRCEVPLRDHPECQPGTFSKRYTPIRNRRDPPVPLVALYWIARRVLGLRRWRCQSLRCVAGYTWRRPPTAPPAQPNVVAPRFLSGRKQDGVGRKPLQMHPEKSQRNQWAL
jgi:hypothetical protein